MKILWGPNQGQQTKALQSQADDLGYGGAAGGGKSDLLLGVAGLMHRRSIIFRKVFPSMRFLLDRSKQIYLSPDWVKNPITIENYNSRDHRWVLPYGPKLERIVEFGELQYDSSVLKHQGIPHDLKGYDEVTEITEYRYRYTKGWNRTDVKDQRCRSIATMNPPTTIEGMWVIEYWGAWLKDTHPNPAVEGELRWYTTIDGKDVECPGPEPIEHEGELLKPRSRTFIFARVEDNPYYMETGYKSVLQGLPEPLRSKLLYGDFKAGITDDPYQLLPTAWVDAAMQRYRAAKGKPPEHIPLTQIGVDVARGGKDRTVTTERYAHFFTTQNVHPGVTTANGQQVAALVVQAANGRRCRVAVDAIGVGSSPVDIMTGAGLHVVSVVGSEGSVGKDKSGLLTFSNIRSEIHWKFREALDPQSGENLCIPDDPELKQEMCAIRFEVQASGIKVKPKEEVQELIGRSPDKWESLLYAHADPMIPGKNWFDYIKGEAEKAEKERALEKEREKREAEEARMKFIASMNR